MKETITVELTREEAFFLEIVLDEEKRDCTKLYDRFLVERDKRNGLTYPENAEDSFLRIFVRIGAIREKLDKQTSQLT